MTSNEVHDLQQSGADSFISLLTVSPLNTHQIEKVEPVVCCVQAGGQFEDSQRPGHWLYFLSK